MTTQYSAPSPQSPDTRTPLRRSRDDRMIAGVCGGTARWLNVDATLVRLAAVVLTIFAGSGIPLYIAAWLLIPADGEPESVAARLARR